MRKVLSISVVILALLVLSSARALADKPTGFDDRGNTISSTNDNGFDEYGYNRTARIFSGTGMSWCMAKFNNAALCDSYIGAYANDKLVMKWNAEWDRGNAEGWLNPPYDAWENNEWNGAFPDGSGSIWHYKIVWVGDCNVHPELVPSGGYCIWEQFATIMDQGVDLSTDPVHWWFAHAVPSGYGTYP